MAKVQVSSSSTPVLHDRTTRNVTIELDEAQLYDALFTWLRLNNVPLPSQAPVDYVITVDTRGSSSGYSRYAKLEYTKRVDE